MCLWSCPKITFHLTGPRLSECTHPFMDHRDSDDFEIQIPLPALWGFKLSIGKFLLNIPLATKNQHFKNWTYSLPCPDSWNGSSSYFYIKDRHLLTRQPKWVSLCFFFPHLCHSTSTQLRLQAVLPPYTLSQASFLLCGHSHCPSLGHWPQFSRLE